MKLKFNNDFTNFLENNEFNDAVQIITESEIIKCSAVLLAQHSSVLREYIKHDKELFLTDNKHVRECLIVLYGGSVSLTEKNFKDILKFMVAFDIPGARKQVLDWMSVNRWNLENVGLLINGSMVATKAIGGNPFERTCSKEEIYQPCRLFFGQHLPQIIGPGSIDDRYRNLDSAMYYVISEVVDKTELLTLLLHQDLIPDYIPWVYIVMDQSNYKILLDSFERPIISNAMSLCPRTQFDKLFEKMEDFEIITLKEYKYLNRYKLKINERITVLQSLRFMKECGSLYSCWKILDEDGIYVLSTAFTDKSDQFCVIECLLSWLAANKSSYDKNNIQKILSKSIHHWSGHPENMNVHEYCVNYLKNAMDMLQTPPNINDVISKIPNDRSNFTLYLVEATFHEEIFLQLKGNQAPGLRQFTVSVTLCQDKIPKVSCNISFGNYHLYVYAWKVEYLNSVCKTARLPLYCDPDSAYKTLQLFPYCDINIGLVQVNPNSAHGLANMNRMHLMYNPGQVQHYNSVYISFSVLWVGV